MSFIFAAATDAAFRFKVWNFTREGLTAELLVPWSRTVALEGIGAVLVFQSLLWSSSTAPHVDSRHALGRFVERQLGATIINTK